MIRRRRLKLEWFLLILLAVFVSGSILFKIKCNTDCNRPSMIDYKLPKKSLLSVTNVGNSTESLRHRITSRKPIRKHVTKSMAELGKMDAVNKHFLFLNSVPKSGSEILIFLVEKIQGVNNFKHIRLKGGNKRRLTKAQQEEVVDEIYDIRRNLAIPLSFDRNVYFINFTSFDKQLPTYINLIRHPVAKVMARAILKKTGKYDSYFIRCLSDSKKNCNFKNGRPYDLTIPYFCGHDPRCMLLNNQWALETAKKNVERYYQVVGVLEELDTTLDILEEEIPQFFDGAKKTYQANLLDIYKHKKDPDVPKEVWSTLEESLVKELEFYNWVKYRLFEQRLKSKESSS
ncbi:uronyl 2-sulfotransferase [Dendroctonus ponderosae]|uniref:Sulfotransferase domain-containing protein n=1 Tax=Dendroctonus ponderosae TaxID=77166 RepID=A0AAR5P7J3_DENPD|nr:uronyl 2-sulfotransferase [Dendroctonus ponderosae]KAH1009522.1 hypothetical protein HUJ04_001865 [Dendroctonus ponderosae]KAH1017517.1 hypothetical protein HUJ05_008145 [Dendroctonus ponderosae]